VVCALLPAGAAFAGTLSHLSLLWLTAVNSPTNLIASPAALAVSDGSLRSLRCSPGSRRLRRIRRNDCLEESALVSTRFVGSSRRSVREHRGADRAL
jgi:hypothetical protein